MDKLSHRTELQFLKDLILSPISVFKRILEGELRRQIYIVFTLGAVVTFAKTFLVKRHAITFFQDDTFNLLFSWLSVPQVAWLMLYASYFVFISVLCFMCRLAARQFNSRSLVVSLMSLSGIGVMAQILFYGLRYVFPRNVIVFGGLVVYIWVIVLSVLAIKTTQRLSFGKAVACFVVPASPVILFLHYVGLAPFLAWLS